MKKLNIFVSNFKNKMMKLSKEGLSNVEKVALRRHEMERINHSIEAAAKRKTR